MTLRDEDYIIRQEEERSWKKSRMCTGGVKNCLQFVVPRCDEVAALCSFFFLPWYNKPAWKRTHNWHTLPAVYLPHPHTFMIIFRRICWLEWPRILFYNNLPCLKQFYMFALLCRTKNVCVLPYFSCVFFLVQKMFHFLAIFNDQKHRESNKN